MAMRVPCLLSALLAPAAQLLNNSKFLVIAQMSPTANFQPAAEASFAINILHIHGTDAGAGRGNIG